MNDKEKKRIDKGEVSEKREDVRMRLKEIREILEKKR